jgi:hypothetical protein
MSLGRSNFKPDMSQIGTPPPPTLVDWHILSKATGAAPLSFVLWKSTCVSLRSRGFLRLTSPPMDGGIVPAC